MPASAARTAKAEARKAAFARRKAAHAAYAGTAATDNLLDFLHPHLGKPMSAYMPIRTETDPLPAMAVLARSGALGVPVILGAGKPLEFRAWAPGIAMQDGPFGARIPMNAPLVVPQVVILPLVAFDARGYRLGYGGGYYDRTLELLRAKGPVLAVGFAYGAQELPDLPIEPTDQRLDAVVTETGATVFA